MAVGLASTAGLLCSACSKKPPPSEEQGPRKPRVEVVVTLPSAPPASRQMLEQDGVHVAVVGVPAEGDLEPLLKAAVYDAEAAGSNGTVVVSTRCLRDLQPLLEKYVASFWTLAAIVGARCDGPVKSAIGAAAVIESGTTPKVCIAFDRHTRAFFKVEPLP